MQFAIEHVEKVHNNSDLYFKNFIFIYRNETHEYLIYFCFALFSRKHINISFHQESFNELAK